MIHIFVKKLAYPQWIHKLYYIYHTITPTDTLPSLITIFYIITIYIYIYIYDGPQVLPGQKASVAEWLRMLASNVRLLTWVTILNPTSSVKITRNLRTQVCGFYESVWQGSSVWILWVSLTGVKCGFYESVWQGSSVWILWVSLTGVKCVDFMSQFDRGQVCRFYESVWQGSSVWVLWVSLTGVKCGFYESVWQGSSVWVLWVSLTGFCSPISLVQSNLPMWSPLLSSHLY